jgi:hypothetical protein
VNGDAVRDSSGNYPPYEPTGKPMFAGQLYTSPLPKPR